MPADRARIAGRRISLHPRRQLVDDVVVHAVVLRPRLPRRVDVEARALAQVVAVGIGHAFAARAGVRRDQDDPVLGRVALRAGLGDEVLLIAGQAREPVQHRARRSEEHTSELQSLMRISYAVFCLIKTIYYYYLTQTNCVTFS